MLSDALAVFDVVEPVCEKYNPAGVSVIRRMVAERRASPNASIMVYGVYNAGKSSLINALLGEADRASVADKPETDRVSSYRWREFEILDTPGIDAPISHEQVTREQLCSVDMVIFVVNPRGVVEEAKTLSALLELVARKKKIMLVLNCKDRIEPLDLERIKNELRQRLQDMACQQGSQSVLQLIPIIAVNAKSALKAKLEQKENLLAGSGFPQLEQELYQLLGAIRSGDILASVASELSALIVQTLTFLDGQSDSIQIAKVDGFYAELSRREVSLRSGLKALIEAKTAFIEKRTFSALSSRMDTAQEEISALIEGSNKEVFAELEAELRRLEVDASVLLHDMLECISVREGVDLFTVDAADLVAGETPGFGVAHEIKSSGVDLRALEMGVKQVGFLLKPDHVVTVLKVGKGLLPGLFKGVGPVTMGKTAELIIGKVIPVVGIGLQAAQILSSVFGKDPEEARLREEARQQELQEERRIQAIRDLSEKVAWEFRRAIIKVVDENIGDNFAAVNEKLKVIRSGFSEVQRVRSEERALLVEKLAVLGELGINV